ncbi:hemolysin [Fusobacterium sp.]|uniref:hemolysin n=1 Tax=Fusobacterium sp. TaxID=68766 RepID=UPI002A82FF7E|nr:hemolysin [Fusobacterium sp.]
MMRAIGDQVAKNPEYLSILDKKAIKNGKIDDDVQKDQVSVMNKLLNDALRAKGYAGPDIKMVLTDVTDPNGPYYTDTLTNVVVFDRKMLANANRDQILNALGHEFGHYSKEDNKTGNQTIANYSGEKLEDRTKGMVAKEATEDTLAAIRNNKNVITGEEGKKLADSIPMDRREYSTTGFSGGLSASFEGNLTGGAGHYVSIDWKKGIVEEYDTIEGGMNFSNPDIGITGGISIFPFADSAKDIEGRGKVIGADFDPVWIYNLIVKKSDEKGPFSVGGELVYSAEGKFLGVKLYASKSVYPLGIHGGFVYGTKVINKKVMTIKEYMKKAHIGSDRTVWRYE